MSYALGGVVPLTVTITDADSHPTNPTSIVLTITRPSGATDTPTLGNPETGTYTADYVPVEAGHHAVRWVATNPTLALPDVIDVRPAAPGYLVSLADAKKKCKIPAAVTEHDDTLRDWIEAVTAAVEDHLHEAVVRRAVVEDIRVDWADEVVLGITPVLSLTSVQTVDGVTSWSVGDLHLDGATGVVSCGPAAQMLHGLVRFVTEVGRRVYPANYTKAGMIIIEHLWATERPGNRGAPVAGGGYEDSLNTTSFGALGFAVPNRAIELLGKPPVMGS